LHKAFQAIEAWTIYQAYSLSSSLSNFSLGYCKCTREMNENKKNNLKKWQIWRHELYVFQIKNREINSKRKNMLNMHGNGKLKFTRIYQSPSYRC